MLLRISKSTLYLSMQLGGLPYEDCGGLTNRHISIEEWLAPVGLWAAGGAPTQSQYGFRLSRK
jgi:hypothetical protein